MLTVAIGTEYDDYDGEVYRVLLEGCLGQPVTRWQTTMRFNGDRSVRKLAKPYLAEAAKAGVQHALFAIDNDGGGKRRPEHEDTHEQTTQAADEKDGCRVCWLLQSLPDSWTADGRKRCVVVPVQTLETWLLCLRGSPPFTTATPEHQHQRRVLKKCFFGDTLPPVDVRLKLALAEVRRPDALSTLRQRRSFRHFEAQLASWP